MTGTNDTTKNTQTPPAGHGSVDRLVGRLVPERDTEGPAGTYGCACVSHDARNCSLLRHGYAAEDEGYRHVCECLCHQWVDDES